MVILACYFSNLSLSKSPESTQLSVKGFEDLANQNVIEYGCLSASSTLAFFKVCMMARFSCIISISIFLFRCSVYRKIKHGLRNHISIKPILYLDFFSFLAQNSDNPVYRRIYEHMERSNSLVSSMDEGIQRAKEGNFAFIGESVSLDLAVARHCDLVRAHEVVGMRGYSIAATLGEAFSSTF